METACFVVKVAIPREFWDLCADLVESLDAYERKGVVKTEHCMVQMRYETCCRYLVGCSWLIVVISRDVDFQVLWSGYVERYFVQDSQC